MDFPSYLKVYIYFWHNIESLYSNFIAYIYHNFLNFDDAKLVHKKIKKI